MILLTTEQVLDIDCAALYSSLSSFFRQGEVDVLEIARA